MQSQEGSTMTSRNFKTSEGFYLLIVGILSFGILSTNQAPSNIADSHSEGKSETSDNDLETWEGGRIPANIIPNLAQLEHNNMISAEPDLQTSDVLSVNATIQKRSIEIENLREFADSWRFKDLDESESESSGPSIIGGSNAYHGEFGWQVYLKLGSSSYCGGVLINDCFVLTARHCTQNYYKSEIEVILGEHDRTIQENYEQKRNVLKIIEHPDWDAALLLLDRAAYTGSIFRVNTIGLATSDPAVGTLVTVSGWGRISSTSTVGASILQKIIIPIADKTDCSNQLNQYLNSPVNSNDLCAGDTTGAYANACHGDSGGPMVVQQNGVWRLAGIVNRGAPGCPSYIDYAVYLSVHSISSWIQSHMPTIQSTPGQPCHCLYKLKRYDNTDVIAQFDYANCYIGVAHPGCNEPDEGNKYFVYENRFYIRSHKANDCPLGTWDTCNCKIRDLHDLAPGFTDFIFDNKFYTVDFPPTNCPFNDFTFDSENCFYEAAPFGTTASKYQNTWYTTARGKCDTSIGSTNDGANCYLKPIPTNGEIIDNKFHDGNTVVTPPAGTTAFEHAGNWYHTYQRTCDHGIFDSANCLFMWNIPRGATAFVYQGGYYYGWF